MLGSVHTELLEIAIALVLADIPKNGYPTHCLAQCERTLTIQYLIDRFHCTFL